MEDIVERIKALKRQHNAVILAHNYTLPEIQDVADFVGDSLGLSAKAAETKADVIVFCGVTFMGETAKILSPSKKVLLPEIDAHCAMAAMCTAQQIREAKIKYPDATVVGYVNTTAEAKTEVDICCTSSNAVKIVNSIDNKKVLFVPDANLAAYVASKIPEKVIIPWKGFCPIHHTITANQIRLLMTKHPNAIVIAHPECRPEVLNLADYVGSTERIISLCKESDSKEFIIITEVGMLHRLEIACPGKRFVFPGNAVCPTMKMIDLNSLLKCLENMSGEVFLSKEIINKAHTPVTKMIEIK